MIRVEIKTSDWPWTTWDVKVAITCHCGREGKILRHASDASKDIPERIRSQQLVADVVSQFEESGWLLSEERGKPDHCPVHAAALAELF